MADADGLLVEAISEAEAAFRARRWDRAAGLLWRSLREVRDENHPETLERLRVLAGGLGRDGTREARREAELVLNFLGRPQAKERRGRLSVWWKVAIVATVIAFVAASDHIEVLVNHGWFQAPPATTEALLSTTSAPATVSWTGVYLQPLGSFEQDTAERAASKLRARFSTVPVFVLPAVAIDRSAVSGSQLSAAGLVEQVRARYGSQPRGRLIVAITDLDMRSKDGPWSFALGFTDYLAVVSTARMDPENYVGLDGWRWSLDDRLGKMLTRLTALMYLHHPPSDDPQDLLYERIVSLDHLDFVDEDV